MKVSSQFITRLQKCDKKAFEELFDQYSELLKAIAFRYMKDWQLAEDILQDTFVIIFQKIHQFSNKGSFEGWIKRITVNNALKQLKQNKKIYIKDIHELNVADEKEDNSVDITKTKSLVKKTDFTQQEIFDVIASLPDGFRIVFSMYVLEEYRHKEIAEILEISESTSKTQLLRARKLIQKRLYKKALIKHSKANNEFYKEVIGGKNEEY